MLIIVVLATLIDIWSIYRFIFIFWHILQYTNLSIWQFTWLICLLNWCKSSSFQQELPLIEFEPQELLEKQATELSKQISSSLLHHQDHKRFVLIWKIRRGLAALSSFLWWIGKFFCFWSLEGPMSYSCVIFTRQKRHMKWKILVPGIPNNHVYTVVLSGWFQIFTQKMVV